MWKLQSKYACSMLLLISHICTHWTIKCNGQCASGFHMHFNFPSPLKITRYSSINEALHSAEVPRLQEKNISVEVIQDLRKDGRLAVCCISTFPLFYSGKSSLASQITTSQENGRKPLFWLHLLSVPEVLFIHFCNHVESNQQLIEI